MQRSNKEVEKFYKSKQWKKKRASYIAYRNGRCERCPSAGVIVHHKQYITKDNVHDPNITLNFDNLELLCRKCHNQEHFADDIPYEFDEEGNLVSPPQSNYFFAEMETDERTIEK